MAFTFSSPITVNSAQVPSPQSDFPMLVNYVDTRFKTVGNGGHVQNSSGFDIRPYSDAALTKPLTYELERYNASSGEVIMHVKKPHIENGDVTYLGYGDSGLSSDGSSTATWSSNYVSVYHFADGTTLNVNDSTGLANGTNHSATATAGQIDGAVSVVAASSQYVTAAPGGTGTLQQTISAWANATSFPNAYNAVFGATSAGSIATAMLVKSTGKLAIFFGFTGSQGYDGTGTNTLSASTWYYIVMTYNGATIKGFLNGALDGTAAFASATVNSMTSWDIGQDIVTAGRFFNGAIDEVRVSNVARSGDWITTEYNNQVAPSTFATLGAEVAFSLNSGWYTE